MSNPGMSPSKPVTRGVRRMTLVISVLAFVVGPLLYLLPDQTDRLFAWTINPPLTAAYLGASYTTALIVELLLARQSVWAKVRIFYPATLVFTTLTLAATLLHLDRFHFGSLGLIPRATAIAWLVIYVAAPPVMLGLFVRQLRVPGGDPPRERLFPFGFRLVLVAEAALMLTTGAFLFLAPATAIPLWPWTLTPLTCQAIGAWLIALGFGAGHAVRENSWERAQPIVVGYLVNGVLQLIAVLRFADTPRWDSLVALVYLVYFASLVAVGASGVYAC